MCVIRKAMPKVKKSAQKIETNKALISADKVELLRLQHELESCHTAYVTQSVRLTTLHRSFHDFSLAAEQKQLEMAQRLKAGSEQLNRLREEMAAQEWRLRAAKDFVKKIIETDESSED